MRRLIRYVSLATLLGAASLPVPGFAAIVQVTIDNYAFSPQAVTIAAGDTVVWTNKDAVAHTVTALGKAFDSGAIDPGRSFRHRFRQPGVYPYRCSIHPEMRATVTVRPAP